jgi:hypothetical protein
MREVKDKNTKITVSFILKYYFHRLWRITPPYMLVLFFSASLTRYLGDGPLFPASGYEIDYCKENWWTNVLV